MKRLMWLVSILWIPTTLLFAQTNNIEGIVMEETANGKLQPLEYVNIYMLGTESGAYSDSLGYFSLEAPANLYTLIVSYVGYAPDTLQIEHGRYLNIVLKDLNVLETVEVKFRKKSTEVSYLDPFLVQNISEEELFKAACCNLSESFETNASVDVNFTDAVTGAKEIQMLGLAGKYSMLSQEFMPGIRGLAIPYGLLYTPGTWVESIQITKGAGSVVNGFESMSGQINVELKKPEGKENLFINGYINEALRTELNVNVHTTVSPKLKTSILAHGSLFPKRFDRNDDGFADKPEGHLVALVNRWKFDSQKGLKGQIGIKYLKDKKVGGQMDFDPDIRSHAYGVEIDANRFEAWGKIGFVFPYKRYQSIGFQWTVSAHEQDAQFGLNTYRGDQKTAYANLIFQSIIGTSDHQYKVGASLLYDRLEEEAYYAGLLKRETVPGVFAEYTYLSGEKFTAVLGLRVDHHSIYDWIWSPRAHLRYAPTEQFVFRASAGKGYRSPNVISENLSLLASSRVISVISDESAWPLGLPMESSWNFGVSAIHHFTIDYRPGFFSLDFYRTSFQDQVVVDLDQSPRLANIYPLQGDSYSNSFMAETSYELFKRFDVKAAYRFQDVKMDFNEGTLMKPFVAKHRGFLNVGYSTRKSGNSRWLFDATLLLTGAKRIPDTRSNPEELQLAGYSPDFLTIHAQITKQIIGGLDFYLGSENLTNFKQKNPILAANDPFGQYFDSTLIWGPVFGRNIYFGIRYQIRDLEG